MKYPIISPGNRNENRNESAPGNEWNRYEKTGHYMNEKHRQLLIGDLSMRGVALYTMACRHLPAFIDKSGAHQSQNECLLPHLATINETPTPSL